MLQIGERGSKRGKYRIAELNSAGVLQNVGRFLSVSDAVANGYQELFELDLNGDGHKGIPVATDNDQNGFVDGLGHYRLMGSSQNVDFKGRRGTLLSARSSRSWDALMSKAKGDGSGFDVLIQGTRGRHAGKYQVWQADANGTVTSNGSWMNLQTLVNEGYESTFNKDFDGKAGLTKTPSERPEVDSNLDGFVDGLGHYRLIGGSQNVDFKGRRGTLLSARSSRSWDALMSKAKGDGSGFDVLIQGTRGRYNGKYQVWSTDTSGTVTSNSRWMNLDTLVNEGYETTFNKDLDGKDGVKASPLDLPPLDVNSDGLVDGITNYTLFKKAVGTDPAQAIKLTNSTGQELSDRTSRAWNVIRAAEDGSEFKVLVQGERGRRRSQYQVWTADSTGQITDNSRWLRGSQLAGYETLFSFDANNNGIGI